MRNKYVRRFLTTSSSLVSANTVCSVSDFDPISFGNNNDIETHRLRTLAMLA